MCDYIISRPLLIPSNYGNLRMIDGTIGASTNFSKSLTETQFWLTIGNDTMAGNCNNNECNQNIAIQNIEFESLCMHELYILYLFVCAYWIVEWLESSFFIDGKTKRLFECICNVWKPERLREQN